MPLTLTRRRGEALYLVEDGRPPIKISISRWDRYDCRISITAPKVVNVIREELLDEDEFYRMEEAVNGKKVK